MLGKTVGNARDASAGKLVPNWEGSYKVAAIAGTGGIVPGGYG